MHEMAQFGPIHHTCPCITSDLEGDIRCFQSFHAHEDHAYLEPLRYLSFKQPATSLCTSAADSQCHVCILLCSSRSASFVTCVARCACLTPSRTTHWSADQLCACSVHTRAPPMLCRQAGFLWREHHHPVSRPLGVTESQHMEVSQSCPRLGEAQVLLCVQSKALTLAGQRVTTGLLGTCARHTPAHDSCAMSHHSGAHTCNADGDTGSLNAPSERWGDSCWVGGGFREHRGGGDGLVSRTQERSLAREYTLQQLCTGV